MLVRSCIEFPNGAHQKVDILVDTGAEANLIRQGLVPEQFLFAAKNPLRFETANGESLAGGSRCTRVKLKLQLERNESNQGENVEFEVEFYEANIKCDAILSFPWLAQAKLGIFPHHKALVMDSADLQFLFGLRDKRKRQANFPKCGSIINQITATDVDTAVACLEKFGFHLPVQGFDQRLLFLRENELRLLSTKLNNEAPPAAINKIIIAREGTNNSDREDRVKDLKGAVQRDF